MRHRIIVTAAIAIACIGLHGCGDEKPAAPAEAPKVEASKPEAGKTEAKPEAGKTEAKPEAGKTEAPKAETAPAPAK